MDRGRFYDGELSGYFKIQATRPQTLAYGLDRLPRRPAGLDRREVPGVDGLHGRSPRTPSTATRLLTNVMLYWLTADRGLLRPALLRVHPRRRHPAAPSRPARPTAVAVFPHDIALPIRAFAERDNVIARWTEFGRGRPLRRHGAAAGTRRRRPRVLPHAALRCRARRPRLPRTRPRGIPAAMRSRPRLRPAALALALALAAAGCGGSGPTAPPAPRSAATTPAPAQGTGIDPAVLPPRSVPRRATGAADPASVRVIQRWLRALRHGQIARAAALFALPSRFQNGTPVLHLDTRTEALAVTVSFPCGAVATRFAGAGAYTLVRFRLTSRTNGDCRGAEGNTTGGAIRVVGGRIRDWFRLYDADELQPQPAAIDPGTQAA